MECRQACFIPTRIEKEGEKMTVPPIDYWGTLPNIVIRGVEIGVAMGGLLIAALVLRKKKLAKQLKKSESEKKPGEIQP